MIYTFAAQETGVIILMFKEDNYTVCLNFLQSTKKLFTAQA
jgi:hypothetical protein